MRSAPLLATLTLVLGGACARQADIAVEEKVIRDLDKKWVQAVAAKDTMTIATSTPRTVSSCRRMPRV